MKRSKHQRPREMTTRLEQYLERMQVLNYSERTVRNHRFCLGYFFDWCEERSVLKPQDVTKPILERYQRYLYHYRNEKTDKPLSFRSQNARLVPIRAFFKWLAKNNYILYNPSSELEMPKMEKRLPRNVLTAKEVEQIINLTDVSTVLGIRDRAILETLYSTGIRRTEMTRLSIYEMDVERGTLFIRQGKGKKDRVVPIGDRAIKWCEKYVHQARPHLVVDPMDITLFITNRGTPFRPKRLSERVHNCVEAANLGKHGSCHLFRHTMATLMLENGADIRYIQAILGHENLETTEIYTQVSIRKLKEIHTATHPAKLSKQKQGQRADNADRTAERLPSLAAEAEAEA